MARIDSFLRLVAEQQASDLHFHSGNPPIIRHDGELMPLPFRTLTRDEVRRFIFEILTPEQKEEFERTNELDFINVIDGVGRFRTNILVQTYGIGAVFRIIPQVLPELGDLMFPRAIRKLTQLQNGLVLVCGPTGCGKTTTLAAMVNEINRTSQRHVITIEDPIEFLHTPIQSTITQRQVGKHTDSFSGALRSALRESPDVIVIGEMRDLETITLALSATETGVLVFGTLHTNSASKAIDRIIDAVGEDGQDQMRAVLSVLLRAVVSQQLCKTASSDGSGAQSLDHAIFNFVKEGAVTLEEGMRVASYPEQLKGLVQELPQDN